MSNAYLIKGNLRFYLHLSSTSHLYTGTWDKPSNGQEERRRKRTMIKKCRIQNLLSTLRWRHQCAQALVWCTRTEHTRRHRERSVHVTKSKVLDWASISPYVTFSGWWTSAVQPVMLNFWGREIINFCQEVGCIFFSSNLTDDTQRVVHRLLVRLSAWESHVQFD